MFCSLDWSLLCTFRTLKQHEIPAYLVHHLFQLQWPPCPRWGFENCLLWSVASISLRPYHPTSVVSSSSSSGVQLFLPRREKATEPCVPYKVWKRATYHPVRGQAVKPPPPQWAGTSASCPWLQRACTRAHESRVDSHGPVERQRASPRPSGPTPEGGEHSWHGPAWLCISRSFSTELHMLAVCGCCLRDLKGQNQEKSPTTC